MEGLEKILRMKPIVLPRYLFNYYLRLGITAEELIILIFVIDKGDKVIYDPSSIGESLGMDKYKVMELLNNLSEKKIISIIVEKNSDGKSAEYISLDLLYSNILHSLFPQQDIGIYFQYLNHLSENLNRHCSLPAFNSTDRIDTNTCFFRKRFL